MFRLLIFTSCLALSAAAWGQSVPSHIKPLRFEAAVAQAVHVAPTVNARESQTVAAREEAVRAAALPDPMLTGGVDNLTATGADAFDFAADDQTMKRVGITQVFPARAKRLALQGVADRRIDEAQALTAAEQLAVRRAAAQAWVNLWAAEREAAELRQLRGQTAIALSVAKARLSGGTGTVVEALATKAGALELENRITGAETQVQAARDTLARWLDLDPQDVLIEDEPPDLMTLPISEAVLLSSIEKQGPLLPWASREAVAEAEVTLARAQKKPDWSLGASYGQRSGGRSDMVTLEFSIDLPVFAANRQENILEARCKCQSCSGHIRYMYPLIAGLGRPCGSLHRQQWNAKFRTCGNRMAAHLRGKGVGGIHHMADVLVAQVLHQTLHTAKTTHAGGQGGRAPRQRCAGVRVDRRNARVMQLGGQNIGIKSAA